MATAINLQIFGFGRAVVSSVPDVAWQEKKIPLLTWQEE